MLPIQYAILFSVVALGGALAFFFQKNYGLLLRWVLSFSGSYLLGITILHLLPGVFSGGSTSVGYWILLGFLIQLALEQLSRGIEHGHVHAHRDANLGLAAQVMLGLSLHALLEGMPLSHYDLFHDHTHAGHQHGPFGNHLFWGILLHKMPAAFALVLLLLQSGFSRRLTIFCLIVFALMSPLGAGITQLIPISEATIVTLMAVVVGSLLHISTTILFEADDTHHHRISWQKLAAIGMGIGLSVLAV